MERAMRIHDVSLEIRPGMTTWASEPGPTIAPLRRIAKGDGANVSVVTLATHTGTHVDPPVHFIDGAASVESLPLDVLVGPCVVVEHREPGHVTAESLERADLPAGTTRLLLKTRNSRLWAEDAPFTRDFVAVSAPAARWCVARGIRLVGIDYLSIEPQGPEKAGYPTHHTLLGAGVVIVEGLDLSRVAAGPYDLVCAPLRLAGGDGSPARVLLIERTTGS